MKRNPMTILIIFAALSGAVALAVVGLAGCATAQYCEAHTECLDTEYCDLGENQCKPNPCLKGEAGATIGCDGQALVSCGEDLLPEITDCGAAGCNADLKRCNECPPSGGTTCDGDRLVTCGDGGVVTNQQTCATGCEVLSATEARCKVCPANFVGCFTDRIVTCDGEGEPINVDMCPYGCTEGEIDCDPCPQSGTGCDEATQLTCDAWGEVIAELPCTYGCDVERGVCNECTPGITSCVDNSMVICTPDGLIYDATLCPYGCSPERSRCNECEADSVTCENDALVTCGPDGFSGSYEPCAYGCNLAREACNECNPGTVECHSSGLITCSADGLIVQSELCPMGCLGAAVPQRCLTFTPTNLLEADLHAGQTDLVVTGYVTIDTDQVKVNGASPPSYRLAAQGGGAPDILVLHYRNVNLQPNQTLRVIGARALALVASESIEIRGLLDAAAHESVPGPGGETRTTQVASGCPGCGGEDPVIIGSGECDNHATGGGGAGYGAGGGNGGGLVGLYVSHSGGDGGVILPNTSLSPIHGGFAGGVRAGYATLAGAGGGALALVARVHVEIHPTLAPPLGILPSRVDVSGGGGYGYGGGGGAGGGVVIEAPEVVISGEIYAVGGGGGCGGTNARGADGRYGGERCDAVGHDGNGGHGGRGDSRLNYATGGIGISGTCWEIDSDGGGGGGAAGLLRIKTASAGGGLTVGSAAQLRVAPCGAAIADCYGSLSVY